MVAVIYNSLLIETYSKNLKKKVSIFLAHSVHVTVVQFWLWYGSWMLSVGIICRLWWVMLCVCVSLK